MYFGYSGYELCRMSATTLLSSMQFSSISCCLLRVEDPIIGSIDFRILLLICCHEQVSAHRQDQNICKFRFSAPLPTSVALHLRASLIVCVFVGSAQPTLHLEFIILLRELIGNIVSWEKFWYQSAPVFGLTFSTKSAQKCVP
jgi:hypothetical protein